MGTTSNAKIAPILNCNRQPDGRKRKRGEAITTSLPENILILGTEMALLLSGISY